MSQKPSFPLDPRPAALLERYHRRTRSRRPGLQGVLFAAIAPFVLLLSRVRISGREHIPDSGFILAPNHPSQLDAFFAAVALGRRVRFMAKSGLFTRRWGRWLARVGAFPVRRGVWDEEAFKTAETLLERGKVLATFFEGGVSPIGGYRDPDPSREANAAAAARIAQAVKLLAA